MLAAGETFHSSCFRLAYAKNKWKYSLFLLLYKHAELNSPVFMFVLDGRTCTISKIMKEYTKPLHSDFYEFRNEKRTGWKLRYNAKPWKLHYGKMESARQAEKKCYKMSCKEKLGTGGPIAAASQTVGACNQSLETASGRSVQHSWPGRSWSAIGSSATAALYAT